MKKRIVRNGRDLSGGQVQDNILVIDLDVNQKWIVQMVDGNGKLSNSRMRYSEKELLNHYDLKIEVHNQFPNDEE